MKLTLGLGLIGCGRIGRIHAEHAASSVPEADLKMVYDVDSDASASVASQWNVRHSTDVHELLENPGIDAVVICTPTETHAELSIAAAEAGKHIFCEKPISLDLEQIDRVIAAADSAGVTLQVGFNRRFDANFRRVKQAVDSGEIGTPHLLHIISRDPQPPSADYLRRSGGMFLDMTIHDFDMARYLIGREVVEVYAAGGVRVDPAIGALGDIDTAVVVLKFEDGTIATIDNSRQAVYGYDQRVEVFGSEGSAAASNRFPNEVEISSRQHVRRDVPLHFFLERYKDSFRAELASFVQAVRSGGRPEVDGHDGRVPVALALAAARSLEENQPIPLSEVDV